MSERQQPVVSAVLNVMTEALSELAYITAASDLAALLSRVGYLLPEEVKLDPALLSRMGQGVRELREAAEALSNDQVHEEDYIAFGVKAIGLYRDVADLARSISSSLGGGVDAEVLARRIFDHTLYRHLERHHGAIISVLSLLGIARLCETNNSNAGMPVRGFDIAKVAQWIRDPKGAARSLYGRDGALDASLFFDGVDAAVRSRGILGGIYPTSDGVLRALDTPASRAISYRITVLHDPQRPSEVEAGFHLCALVDDQKIKNLYLLPFASGELSAMNMNAGNWVWQASGTANVNGTPLLCLYPLDSIDVVPLSEENQDSGVGRFQASLTYAADAELKVVDSPELIIGIRRPKAEASFLRSLQNSELQFELGFEECHIGLQGDKSDGFLNSLLGDNRIEARFGLFFGWSSINDVYFKGGAALEATIPVHKSMGPLAIQSVYVAVRLGQESGVVLATTFSAKLGPVGVSIERMGLEIPLRLSDRCDGNFGPIDVKSPKFLVPIGAGISIKTESITGGGFVELDKENRQYAGILQLSFKKFALTAIGLITTKMPDGSKGFSILIIICAEFKPGIALGYGFFLDGAGGLVGVHRTLLVDVLRDGLKTGTADAILFPENPILNAPRIISDLRSVFPPSEGHFIIGPIALISFMQLARFEIGIMIELPGPSRIVLVGQNSLKLPNATNPRLEIHEDILGVIDFDRKTLSYDATIYNSHFLKFTLTGDSALRLVLSENKSFAAAAGGLNPRFDPPPGFPTLRRLCLSLGNGDNPRINLETYVAITSNSAQHGSRVEIYASKGKFGIKGHMGYDVLLVFSPFSFIADMNAGVSVSAFGETICSADLDLTLSGPSPWKATGKATFEFFRMKKSVDVSATWGDEEPASLEAVDPSYQLIEELKKPISLAGILPGDRDISVSLRPPANPQSNEITVHPEGKLEVRQRVLPLQIELAKFGGAPIIGTNFFDVVARSDRADAPEKDIQDEPLMDDFARGQFEELSDSEKLSCPSYEKFKAGILIGSDGIACEHAVPCMLEYETQVIDENGISQPRGFQRLPWRFGARFVAGSAARLGNKRNSGSNRYANPGATPIVRTKEEGYVVVWTKDLTRFNSMKGNDGSMTFTKAKQELAKYLRENPGARGSLEVVRTHEAQPERAVA